MSLDDWILALHVLSAFVLVAAMIVLWVLVVAARGVGPEDGPDRLAPLSRLGSAAVIAGSVGTLVFGVWLALTVGDHDLWDGWILAALALWAIGVGTGMRSGAEFARGNQQGGVLMHAISSIAVLLILVDMIWKPGA